MIDAAIYGVGLYIVVDILQTEIGAATKSFLALGSVSTLVVSLAMQGFVAQVLHGLFLASSNRIAEGDTVEIGGNIKGTVVVTCHVWSVRELPKYVVELINFYTLSVTFRKIGIPGLVGEHNQKI